MVNASWTATLPRVRFCSGSVITKTKTQVEPDWHRTLSGTEQEQQSESRAESESTIGSSELVDDGTGVAGFVARNSNRGLSEQKLRDVFVLLSDSRIERVHSSLL